MKKPSRTPPTTPATATVVRVGIDRFDWIATAAIALFTAFVGWFVLTRLAVPLYQVETDLLGEYIPAARALLEGVIDPAHYTSKGVGYPLLLAATGALCGGDLWLGARLLNVAAAAGSALLCYRLCRAWFSSEVALATLLGLLVNPNFVQATIEAATDLTALALTLGSMLCLTEPVTGAARPNPRAGLSAARLAVAGFIAGFTVITRSNFVVLPLAAGLLLLFRRAPLRAFAGYALGCAVPIAAWGALSGRPPGSAAASQNVLNVAYEFYGNSMRDAFWTIGTKHFHNLLDVVRFDPLRFTSHWLRNLGTRWLQDVSQLLTPPMGVPAIIGIVLGAWRGRRRWMIALHFLCVYAVLATVFYLPRFSLSLVPLYLCAAAWLVLDAFGTVARSPRAATALRVARWAVWLTLLVPVARQAVTAEARLLAAAPVETRAAGEILRRIAMTGEAPVMASKPHVAHFAGQRYVPLPTITTYAELFDAARATGARYLFYSMPETDRCPQFLGLLSPGAELPGLEVVEQRMDDPRHYFGLFRFTGERVNPAALDSASIVLTQRLVAEHPTDLLAIATLGDQLERAGRPREALAVMETPSRAAPAFAPIARFQALSYLDLGLVDSAGIVAERLTSLPDLTGWDWALLGHILSLQGRPAESRDAYARAVRQEPARDEYRRALARADSLMRDSAH